MPELVVKDLKAFVPALDYEISLDFYRSLGAETRTLTKSISEVDFGSVRFFLQDYYVPKWANNFVMFINVTDTQAWYEHIKQLQEEKQYPNVRFNEVRKESWGDLVVNVWDPSGVLLWFTQSMQDGEN